MQRASRFAFELGDPPRYDRPPRQSLSAARHAAGVAVKDLVYDVLGPEHSCTSPSPTTSTATCVRCTRCSSHPRTLPGLSDGGAHCTMIADFDYPTFLLSYWGRDAPDELRMPVEWAVQQQSAATAALVGMHDRGTLTRASGPT